MAELVDAHDSKSCGEILESSILSPGTVEKQTKPKTKILVVVGPTTSGKTPLAVKLARSFNGEVVSADSRQVYKGLDLGSGKVTREDMHGVPHHMLDVASPKRIFSVAQFQKMAEIATQEIAERGNVPIICGGSGFYIQALVDSTAFPEAPPDHKLRDRLEKKPTEELCRILRKLDRRRYNEIDKHNRVRLIRAIEITKALGKVPRLRIPDGTYDPLFIGIVPDPEVLREKIHRRLRLRLRQGMINEVVRLHNDGVSWKRLEDLGLEYRYVSYFLQNKMNRAEMIEQLEAEIWKFSKRQMVWFKRDTRIHWFNPKEWTAIKKLSKDFLTGKITNNAVPVRIPHSAKVGK